LESLYRAAEIVQNICVYASEQKTKPIAIIVPVEAVLKKKASELNAKGDSLETWIHDPKIQDAVLKDLQAAGRKGGLLGIEIIEGVVLADEEWTPQNNLVTSAQKLNRRGILAQYKKEVEAAYAKSG
jgi:long-chain acyl-CoA synthetase